MLEAKRGKSVQSQIHHPCNSKIGGYHGVGRNGFSRNGPRTPLPQEGECSCILGMHSYPTCLLVAKKRPPNVSFATKNALPIPILHPPCFPQELLSGALKFISPRSVQFQQDGASSHTAKSTKKWLAKKKVRLFNGGKWPAHSPDLNPIEHLWPVVSRNLVGRCFSWGDSLWAELQVQFDAIPKDRP